MTDGLEASRRSEVAESYRYARAFYDDAEATGPAAFERNRQAIIDVIALAYRDGRTAAQQPDDALRVAARDLWDITAHIFDDAANPVVLDSIAEARDRLDAALYGAPYEPSEEMVERTADAIRRELHVRKEYPMSTLWTDTARAALRAAFSPPPADPPASA